jgi:hypothetical protein
VSTRPAIGRSRIRTTGGSFTADDARPPSATYRPPRQLDLDLELPADLDHARHCKPVDSD